MRNELKSEPLFARVQNRWATKGSPPLNSSRDANGDFYFLEVNPRVQVEHTVTELITGHNLVELGIRVAQGEALPLKQEDITWRGHSIQCRLANAEDPREFVSKPGPLVGMPFPEWLRYSPRHACPSEGTRCHGLFRLFAGETLGVGSRP